MLKPHFESPYSLALFIRIYRVGKERGGGRSNTFLGQCFGRKMAKKRRKIRIYGKCYLSVIQESAMARATRCRPCIVEFNCFITGHDVYKDISSPRIQEELTWEREPGNQHDEHVVKVLKDGEIVGHIPRLFSKTCNLILLPGGSMKVCVTGKRVNKRGKGLEVPCLVTVKVSEHILSKVEPIIKDLCK